MKKPVVALIAMAVLAGGSVGAFMAVQNKKNKEEEKKQEQIEDNVLFSFDSEAVSKIEFNCSDGQYIVEKNDDGEWKLSNSDEFNVDELYIQLIRTYTAVLKAELCYGEATEENKAMYGLDNPEKIVITENGNEHIIYLGNVSPTGDYYYVMTGDKKNIYAIDQIYGSALYADKLTLKAKDLVPYEIDEISKVTIKKDGKISCELFYDSENQAWSLDKKYDMVKTDMTAITAEINNLIRLDAEEMLDENLQDLSKYGFDKPDGEVIFEGLDGSERSFSVKLYEEDPDYSYVLIGEDKQVEIYYTADVDVIDSTPYDYIIQRYSGVDMYDINGFELELDGKKISVEIDAENKKCKLEGKNIDIDTDESYIALQNFYGSFSSLEIKGLDIDAAPKLESPVVSVVYHTKEDGDTKLDIVNEDDRYYIFKDGKCTGAYTDETRFKGRTSIGEYYTKFAEFAK